MLVGTMLVLAEFQVEELGNSSQEKEVAQVHLGSCPALVPYSL